MYIDVYFTVIYIIWLHSIVCTVYSIVYTCFFRLYYVIATFYSLDHNKTDYLVIIIVGGISILIIVISVIIIVLQGIQNKGWYYIATYI